MEPPKIIENGLVVRAWRADDAESVTRACQDPDIQRWTAVPVPYRTEHAEYFVSQLAPSKWRDGTGAPLGVFDEATGELVGSSGLISLSPDRSIGEIGYWTAPWARGRGAATAATRAVARWAINDLGVRRLVWRAEVGNHLSRLVALRAGFTMEGIARDDIEGRDGLRRDTWVAALLAGETTEPEVAGPGSPVARRAVAFSRPQPELFASTRGGEIRLRALEDRDVDAIVESADDPETVRWTTMPHPYHRSHGEGFVRDAAGIWRRGTGAIFAIGDPADDAYAGIMELRLHPTRADLSDVGFVVPPRARGRGFASAALSAICAWGFTALGVHRIGWWANLGNEASRRVAEKAGFTFEGTARGYLDHRGTWVDAWAGALLASDEPFNGRKPV